MLCSCLLCGMGGKEEEGGTGIGRKEGRDLLKLSRIAR
jgi:hypothetical protein